MSQALIDVTVNTIQPKGRGEETHDVHELTNGSSLQNLDVLEDLFRQHFV